MIKILNKYLDKFLSRLDESDINIGILGLGYVGLPLALSFCESNIGVCGYDLSKKKIQSLNAFSSYLDTVSDERIKINIANNLFKPTNKIKDLEACDVYIICVPTPLTNTRDPDLSYILSALDLIIPNLKKGNLISLESTTYPGTTEEIIAPRLYEKNYLVGEDIFLVYSPEREDPGNKKFTNKNIPKIVGGMSPNCSVIGSNLYSKIVNQVVTVSDTKTAEMTKLLENIHRAVNIGLMNELKPLTSKMGIDIYEVIEAAATKPFGFVPYYPGPGLGGHCIPIDPFYLTWKARSFGMNTKFIELAGEINSAMPCYVLAKINASLNKIGLPVKNSKILILGLAYKADISDCRESPSITIINELLNLEAKVVLSDPFIQKKSIFDIFNKDISNIEINKNNLKDFDLIVLLTKHSCYDYELIASQSKLIVDTRGAFPKGPHIIHA